MNPEYVEFDASPDASLTLSFFAELEAQEGSRFDVDDYDYLQCLSLTGEGRLACEAYHRSFDE